MDLPSWAYDPESFDPKPPQELICSICTSVLQDPVQSLCNHFFCRSCIYQWLESKPNCPICQHDLTLQSVGDAIPVFKSLVMGLNLQCPHCGEKFTLQNCRYHLQQCGCVLTTEERKLVEPNEDCTTRLLRAASDKSLHHLIHKIMISERETINVKRKERHQETPLLLALRQGCSEETLDVLMKAGACVEARNGLGQNALHLALMGNCPLPVRKKILHCNKEMVNQKDNDGTPPLNCGLLCSLEVFLELVEAGADLSVLDNFGASYLHQASILGSCKEILEEIIRRQPDLIHLKDEDGRIPLHWASKEWVVRTLLEAGSDAGARDKNGNTPLQSALLLTQKIEQTIARNKEGLTPLQRGYFPKKLTEQTIVVFLEHMSPEQQQNANNYNETLLHAVCEGSYDAKLLRRIMKMGLDPAKKNKLGDTAMHIFLLHHAASGSARETCKELLREHPYLVEIRNKKGESVLDEANVEFVKEIVKWVSLQNVYMAQRCVLAIKEQSDKKDIVLFLEKCQEDLKLLQEHRVCGIFSFKDLLLKDYLTEDDTSSFWEECVSALDFETTRLSVFKEEVSRIQERARESKVRGMQPHSCVSAGALLSEKTEN